MSEDFYQLLNAQGPPDMPPACKCPFCGGHAYDAGDHVDCECCGRVTVTNLSSEDK